MSISIPAKYELIWNSCISHLFKLFPIPGKIFDTITKPIVHTERAPQPIMNRRSPPNRPIKSPIIIVVAPIRPVIPIIAIALRAIPNSGQFNVLLPAMDKEWTVPVILVPIPLPSASFFFPTIVFLLAPIPILPLLPGLPRSSMSYHNTGSWRPS